MTTSPISDNCSICLDALENETRTFDLHPNSDQVSHVFHLACIKQALETTENCPLCRKQISLAMKNNIQILAKSVASATVSVTRSFPKPKRPHISQLYAAVKTGDKTEVLKYVTRYEVTCSERSTALRIASINKQFDIASVISNSGPVEEDDLNYMYNRISNSYTPFMLSPGFGHPFYI